MKNLLLVILISSALACHNANSPVHKATIIHKNAAPASALPVIKVLNDTLIQARFEQSDTNIIAAAHSFIDGNKHVVCEVNITKADSLHATLTPDADNANIRFTQIILPDGKADGPFGRTLNYATPQSGTYKLLLGENMMARDKWQGKFRVQIWVK